MISYIFDVDGTLTPSRLAINSDFQLFFQKWMKNKKVYLVTGSDKEKTVEQIGEILWNSVTRVYQSCGNQVWEKGRLIKENEFYLSNKMKNTLNTFLETSRWKEKFGNHIEQRIGLVNFSIIGRDCPLEKREEYYAWDNINRERGKICDYIMREFPDIEASIGGQISIDMHHLGLNKAQVLDDIPGKIYFFGDRMDQAGNDYPIVKRLQESEREYRLFKVKNPEDTWKILQNL